jgi:hypothetical protein
MDNCMLPRDIGRDATLADMAFNASGV